MREPYDPARLAMRLLAVIVVGVVLLPYVLAVMCWQGTEKACDRGEGIRQLVTDMIPLLIAILYRGHVSPRK